MELQRLRAPCAPIASDSDASDDVSPGTAGPAVGRRGTSAAALLAVALLAGSAALADRRPNPDGSRVSTGGLLGLAGAKALYPGATKPFPAHWGEPPNVTTRDYRKWPAGFGHGSGTIAKWIEGNLAKDQKADSADPTSDAAQMGSRLFPGASKPFPAHWGQPPKAVTEDIVEWPGGYGNGSGTIAKWIEGNLANDQKADLAGAGAIPTGLFPGATKPFPAHWGEPPKAATKDFVDWPEGYGHGSGSIAKWIQENLDRDEQATQDSQLLGGRRGGRVKLSRVDVTLSESNGTVFYRPHEGTKSPIYPTYVFDGREFNERVGELGKGLEGTVVFFLFHDCAPFSWEAIPAASSWESPAEQSAIVERRRLRSGRSSGKDEDVVQQEPEGGFLYPQTACSITSVAKPGVSEDDGDVNPKMDKEAMREHFAAMRDKLQNMSSQIASIMSSRAGEDPDEWSKKVEERIAQHRKERGYGNLDAHAVGQQLAEVAQGLSSAMGKAGLSNQQADEAVE
ncbi:unnamed protein product [Prorocentrum cordatum]|uniref:Uncharacterized protein n=1 Tax=Prorocentrum cordatum TaxID=2364126 RepID=A0ABN9VUD2_9DINO|nr:unnamed protein product [Polarella glacialis]